MEWNKLTYWIHNGARAGRLQLGMPFAKVGDERVAHGDNDIWSVALWEGNEQADRETAFWFGQNKNV